MLLMLLWAGPSGAQQYDLRNYGQEQGLPSATVNGLCEDADGFLWVATDGGAARSEGSHFETFDRDNGMPSEMVTALCAGDDGRIWFGFGNGAIAFFRSGSIEAPNVPHGFPKARIRAMLADGTNGVWYGTDGKGIALYSGGSVRVLDHTHGLPNDRVFDIERTHRGDLLVATEGGLALIDAEAWRATIVPTTLPAAQTFALYADSSGVLVGTADGYSELGHDLEPLPLSQRFAGVFPVALKDTRVLDIIRAHNGDLWMGTPAGMAHLSKADGFPTINTIGEANGLGHDLVVRVHQDRSGSVWAGTMFGGVSKFISSAFLHFTTNDGLGSNIVSAMYRTPDGLMWFGTFGGGLSRWDDRNMRTFGASDGLSDHFVTSLGEDRSGHLLIGTATQGAFRLVGERVEPYSEKNGIRSSRIFCFHRDQDRLWVGTHDGLFVEEGSGNYALVGPDSIDVRGIVTSEDSVWITTDKGLYHGVRLGPGWTLTRSAKLPAVALTDVARDVAGNLWIGSEEHGMYRLNGNRVDSLGLKDGLESLSVEQVLLDALQNVWLGSKRAITHVELDEMQERILQVRNFGPKEGFVGIETTRNASFLDQDGSLWFGTVQGATRLDLDKIVQDPNEPLLHLTDLRLFYERADWSPWCKGLDRDGLPTALELPYNKNHLTFAFTGISLSYPERVRYRWILQGYDADWSPITATDRVTYSNIPPGDYTFKVMARNASGIWTEHPETYAFVIAPPIWETTTFRVCGGAFVVLGLFGFVRLRERNLRRDRELLENTVTKRTAELATEKERSDALLRNILPASTAEELKSKGSADAQRHERCTVLFSDFKGFTTFSSQMDSDTLVSELDHYFRLFDELCDRYGVEKIKTIGDAYMCASGIPEPTPTHALDAVLMALGMVEAVEESNKERAEKGRTQWPIRIGIHTGPVITGVVGRKKFAYDVWGDTVNLASRMESNSEAGRVNISGTTYAQLMEYVEVLPRGPINVKGKGELNMYFVLRLKPEFSADSAGREPNAHLLAIREQLRGGTNARTG
jgi:class 3 adenylate cyclase/ligand-binding sensor domain-containing protein